MTLLLLFLCGMLGVHFWEVIRLFSVLNPKLQIGLLVASPVLDLCMSFLGNSQENVNS